jgi:hypothetical protein
LFQRGHKGRVLTAFTSPAGRTALPLVAPCAVNEPRWREDESMGWVPSIPNREEIQSRASRMLRRDGLRSSRVAAGRLLPATRMRSPKFRRKDVTTCTWVLRLREAPRPQAICAGRMLLSGQLNGVSTSEFDPFIAVGTEEADDLISLVCGTQASPIHPLLASHSRRGDDAPPVHYGVMLHSVVRPTPSSRREQTLRKSLPVGSRLLHALFGSNPVHKGGSPGPLGRVS